MHTRIHGGIAWGDSLRALSVYRNPYVLVAKSLASQPVCKIRELLPDYITNLCERRVSEILDKSEKIKSTLSAEDICKIMYNLH